ncbi:hypothetical protein [Comamonas resistens]|uniref:DUF4304 domain-containing protein n=1 Tax=Comamonas resistens TaxID=3046670 RepID=A0ABY8SMM3_9BURK|nr:hypothetical protein [Comamonas resistens]MDL5037636.1 hypothetical protein [Comamonas resistens]WHS64327.1 hypothetical protein QMY55_17730 [Comamonas resistens]
MSEIKKSGEFILNNFQIFSEAVYFFEKSINPKILKGIDECVEVFSNENYWNGNFQLEENFDNWLRPQNWENEDGLEAYFEIKSTEPDDDNDNYWVSLFCNKSSNNCEAGFFFGVETKHFGGKRAWDAHIKSLPEEQKISLKEIGFKQFEGHFFLPITLSNEELAKSWQAEDPFTSDDECFEPLRDALEKLKQSVPIFEAIMESALASQDS